MCNLLFVLQARLRERVVRRAKPRHRGVLDAGGGAQDGAPSPPFRTRTATHAMLVIGAEARAPLISYQDHHVVCVARLLARRWAWGRTST